MISNALENKLLPVYGDGMQVRDWLYVGDHCRAIFTALRKGRAGEVYNVGGNCSLPNLEVIKRILNATGRPETLITRITDRPGHDRRYALTNEKLTRETGWQPEVQFDEGLAATIQWYKDHQDWVARVKSGEYQDFYEQNYARR
jgi:dTDP-glucose 4,6-dehydratase